MSTPSPSTVDVAVLGAGAAGLFAALAARGALRPDGSLGPVPKDAPTVVLIDGQEEPGKKILISGGGRCNVTNEFVTEADFLTESPRLVRNALREFGPEQAERFFIDGGVDLHVEPLGKIFPADGNAHDVLAALFDACDQAGIERQFGTVVEQVSRHEATGRWNIDGKLHPRRLVLATGGKSVPATGSTGFGYDLATSLGHDLAPRVPALAPLVGTIGGKEVAGLTVPAIVSVLDGEGREMARSAGSLLFTHKGVTGPAALDVSHAVEQQLRERLPFRVVADLWTLADPAGPMGPHLDAPKLPGCCLADTPPMGTAADLDAAIADAGQHRPRDPLGSFIGGRLPKRLTSVMLGDHVETSMGQLRKADRQAIAKKLTHLDLGITGTAGYQKAEVTAGGIRLAELDRRTLESKVAPGLHACGEVCDVTGRLGGFNFQWAWTSGWLAGRGAAAG